MSRARAALLVAAALAGGCGARAPGDPSASDAAAPPDLGDRLACAVPGGRAFFARTFEIAGPGDGFDLNADGRPDNALAPFGALFNPTRASEIARGIALPVFVLNDLAGPPLVEGQRPRVAFTLARDSRAPVDDARNAAGGGEFLIARQQLDIDCRPTGEFDESEVRSGAIRVRKSRLPVASPGNAIVEFADAVGELVPAPDLSAMTGRIGVVWPACGMLMLRFEASTSLLVLAVAGFGAQPDVDRDGDGRERFESDGHAITACIDGDGARIPGPACACDPRMQDGFSTAFRAAAVPARLVGLTP